MWVVYVRAEQEWKTNVDNRHPSTQHIIRLFEYGHLSNGPLRETSAHCAGLAWTMVERLEDGLELTAGLRHLLEAKDCFVRQALLDSGVE